MTYTPFVSVVIPTFNRARQVQAAIKSVLAQTYPAFEIIIIDDGSTDGTDKILREIANALDSHAPSVRHLSQPNQGQSAARNKGIDEARGEFVAFLDSDDQWLPEKLAAQIQAIDQFPSESIVCITDARPVDDLGLDTTVFHESGKHYEDAIGLDPEAMHTLLTSREPFWISTLIVRTELARRVGGFDVHLGYAEDHDFLFRLSLATRYCYVNKPLCLLDRSKSPRGSTCRPWDNVDVRLLGCQYMFEKWLRLIPQPSEGARKILFGNLRNVHSAWANWHLEHGRVAEARQAAMKAITYGFTPPLAVKWALTRIAPSVARRFAAKMRV